MPDSVSWRHLQGGNERSVTGFRPGTTVVERHVRRADARTNATGNATICFADDTLVVAEGGTIPELKSRANEAIEAVSSWIEEAGLSLSTDKMEAVLFTNRYKYTEPALTLKGAALTLSKSMKYLGFIVGRSMLYKYIKYAAARVQGIMTSLGRLMPNLGCPRPARRKLLYSVIHSVLLYGAPVWSSTIEYVPANSLELQKIQRRAAIRSISGYRTISYVAFNILAGLPLIQLLVRKHEEAHNFRRATGRKTTKAEKETIRIRTLSEWNKQLLDAEKGEWIRALIPDLEPWCKRDHDELTYRLTQLMTGHGCFNKYLARIRKAPNAICSHCGDQQDEDDAVHTLIRCPAWNGQREKLRRSIRPIEAGTLVTRMLANRENWLAVKELAEEVMSMKEEAERERQSVQQ